MTGFVDEIFALFARHGAERYGERVTQLEHALQCGELARRDEAPDALIAAALLHDYGHLVDDRGQMAERDGLDGQHEVVGARALSAWFGPAVTAPIALHVAAKRYLCLTDPAYQASLSPASRLSLTLQGGPMSEVEAAEFEALPHADKAVRLRRWDDWGKKVEGVGLVRLEDFRPILTRASAADRR